MWQLINRNIGKTQEDYKLELKIGNNIISNPTEITEKLNMYFMNIVAELVKYINEGRQRNNIQCNRTIYYRIVIKDDMFRPSSGHHQVYIKDTETYEELRTYMGSQWCYIRIK